MKRFLCCSSIVLMCTGLVCLVALSVLPRFGIFNDDVLTFKPFSPIGYLDSNQDSEADAHPDIVELEEKVELYFSDLTFNNSISASNSHSTDILAGTYLQGGKVNVVFYDITKEEFDLFYDNCVVGNEDCFNFYSADYSDYGASVAQDRLSNLKPSSQPSDLDSLADDSGRFSAVAEEWNVSDVKRINTAGLPIGISALRRDSLDLTGGVRIFINRLGRSFSAKSGQD